MSVEKATNSHAISSFALVAALFFLFISNPKPEQVYVLLQEEAVKNIHEQMSENLFMGLVGTELAREVTADLMRGLFVVHHADLWFASMFVVEPTPLAKLGLQLANKPTEVFMLCGLATKVFPCPSFLTASVLKKLAGAGAESSAAQEATITGDKPNAAARGYQREQAGASGESSASSPLVESTATPELKQLVIDWNEAHSNKDIRALSNLYDDSVLFYRVQKSTSSSIAAKTLLFKKYPVFGQQIFGDMNFEEIGDGEMQCRFLKRVTVNGATTDYPSYLVFRKSSNVWKIVTEGDLVTDSNLEKRAAKRKSIPDGAVKGDFNGDGNFEYMWLQAPKVDTNEFGSCIGDCVSYVNFSDPLIPAIEVESSIGGSLSNLGDLNKNGTDEVGVDREWFTSCWRPYYVWTFKNRRWKQAVDSFSTHCNQWDSGIKPIEIDSETDGQVIIRYSEFADGEIQTKQKTASIEK